MCAAHRPNGLVRFFFQPAALHLRHRQQWESVCTTAHALESFSALHAPNPNRYTTKLVTTLRPQLSSPATALLLVVTLQRLASSS